MAMPGTLGLARLGLGTALVALAVTQALGQTDGQALPDFDPVTDAEIQQPDPGDWLSWRRTLDAMGHSPLKQIDRSNVDQLRMVWARPLPPGHQEGTPLVHDGVMYFPGPADVIEAIDAKSGQLIWQYRRNLPADLGEYLPVFDTTRNVALYGNLIIGNSADNYLYALNARTGELVWETQILDYRQGAKQSSGPIIAEGLAITGRSCEPEGGPAACVITAHNATTGEEVWRTPIIAQTNDPADASWGGLPMERRIQVGAWMIASYDPNLRLVYMGTSVTAPAPKISLAGNEYDYLYHNSTLALDVETGEIRWHYQHLVDQWDLDHTFPRILVDQEVAPDPAQVAWMAPDIVPGRTYRTITGVPGKTGIITTLDRVTGKFLWARPTVRQNVIASIDGETGRPTSNPATVPTEYGVSMEICPSPTGGANYMAGAYSPVSGTIFWPLQNTCGEMAALDPSGAAGIYGVASRAFIADDAGGLLGAIHAVDAVTGRTQWVHNQRAGMQSLITTAGGLVFAGDAGGRVYAMDERSGDILWQMNLGSSVTGYPASFAIDGQQYVAFSTGRWLSDAFTPELSHGTQNTLFVFALPQAGIGAAGPQRAQINPRQELSAVEAALVPEYARTIADGVYSAAQAEAGRAVYAASCATCHGNDLRPAGGVPPVAGGAFVANWRGKSVADLFAYTRDFMPTGMGGSLSDGQYLNVTAYILQANGYVSGEPLDPDETELKTIGIE